MRKDCNKKFLKKKRNSSDGEAEIDASLGLAAQPSLAYMVISRPVRDIVSKLQGEQHPRNESRGSPIASLCMFMNVHTY